MSREIRVPDLPESVSDATVLTWLKQPGDTVERDDVLVELETDKVVLEVPAPADGVLGEIRAQEGDVVEADDLLASFGAGDDADAAASDDAPQAAQPSESEEPPESAQSTPAAPAEAEAADEDAAASDDAPQAAQPSEPEEPPKSEQSTPAAPAEAEAEEEPQPAPSDTQEAAQSMPAGQPIVTPAARRLVNERNIDASQIAGSGRDGRVHKQDVLDYLDHQDSDSQVETAPAETAADEAPAGTSEAEPPAPETQMADEQATKQDARQTPDDDAQAEVSEEAAPADTTEADLAASASEPTEQTAAAPAAAAEDSASQPAATADPAPGADASMDEEKPQAPAPAPAQADAQPAPASEREERVPMTRLRARIAQRLVEAQHTAAMLTTFNEIDLSAVNKLRDTYRDTFEQRHGVRLGYMSFFVKASVAALKRFPIINAAVDGQDIVYHRHHDIGIAVSSPRGLVVPVLRDCDGLSMAEIEQKIRQFGQQARDANLSYDDLDGGTFTITNGGIFGSLLSTPIINPPQSAILGMHRIEQRPVVRDGDIVAAPMMYLALTYDHRIIDGREAVQFLSAIREALEDPARLVLGV